MPLERNTESQMCISSKFLRYAAIDFFNTKFNPVRELNEEGQSISNKHLQEEFDKYITNFFIHSISPLDNIWSQNFKIVLQDMGIKKQGLKLMNRRLLELKINDLYIKMIRNIHTEIQKAKTVALTTKTFTRNVNKKRYMITICHLIDEDLKRKSFVLSCQQFIGSTETTSTIIDKDYQERLAGVRELREFLKEDRFYTNFNETSERKLLENCLIIIVDGIIVVPDIKETFNCYVQPSAITDFFEFGAGKDKDDIRIISQSLECYTPIVEAIETLQNDEELFYGITLPCVLSLRNKISKARENHKMCNNPYNPCLFKEHYRDAVRAEVKFLDLSTTTGIKASIAAISNPQFKTNWLNCLDFEVQQTMKDVFLSAINDEIISQNANSKDNFFDFSRQTNTNNDIKVKFRRNIINTNYIIDESDNENTDTENDNHDRIEKYINDKYVSANDIEARRLMNCYFNDNDRDVSMLNRHTVVKKVFIKYNTAVSVHNRNYNKLNEDLVDIDKAYDSDDMFEKMVVLKCNSMRS